MRARASQQSLFIVSEWMGPWLRGRIVDFIFHRSSRIYLIVLQLRCANAVIRKLYSFIVYCIITQLFHYEYTLYMLFNNILYDVFLLLLLMLLIWRRTGIFCCRQHHQGPRPGHRVPCLASASAAPRSAANRPVERPAAVLLGSRPRDKPLTGVRARWTTSCRPKSKIGLKNKINS